MIDVEEIFVPEGWAKKPLRDISEKLVDGSHNPPKKQDSGLPMLSARNIENGLLNWDANYRFIAEDDFDQEDKRTKIEADDVLLTIVGTIGRACVVPKNAPKFTLQRSVAVIKPIEIDPKFVCYQLQSLRVQHYLNRNSKGTAQKGIYLKALGQMDMLIASPEQQKRIVAKIEELFSHIDAGIEALKKAKQLLTQYRQSVLKAAVTGELTKEWREANKDKLEPASQLLERVLKERRQKWEEQQLEQFKAKGKIPKDDKWKAKYDLEEPNPHMILEVPDEWALSTLESITDPVRVICYGILMPKDNKKDGVLYVKVKDIKGGKVLLHQLNRTASDIAKKYERASLIEGDLLLAIRGSYGRTAIAPGGLEGGNITQDTVRISAISPISNVYIQLFIDSNVAQHYFKLVARGVAVKGVNVQDIRNMNVSIPSREEQDVIVIVVDEKLTSISHLEKEIGVQVTKAEKSKQSILALAFSGKLL